VALQPLIVCVLFREPAVGVMFLNVHESSFRVPYDCYLMAAHWVLGLTPGHASCARKCPRRNESTGDLRGSGSSLSTTSFIFMFEEWTSISMFMDNCSHYVIRLHDRIDDHVWEKFRLRLGQVRGGTCVWRFAESGLGLPRSSSGCSVVAFCGSA
jgi:hypothetical protein